MGKREHAKVDQSSELGFYILAHTKPEKYASAAATAVVEAAALPNSSIAGDRTKVGATARDCS